MSASLMLTYMENYIVMLAVSMHGLANVFSTVISVNEQNIP